ncbi:restin homolog [Clytia hemisphaerica]|uniref:TRAF-type domain-containing protein n=1 Tax=Clytia hemisphaerica TaxID=252671 RepID=A0A7M5UPE2_9CNID
MEHLIHNAHCEETRVVNSQPSQNSTTAEKTTGETQESTPQQPTGVQENGDAVKQKPSGKHEAETTSLRESTVSSGVTAAIEEGQLKESTDPKSNMADQTWTVETISSQNEAREEKPMSERKSKGVEESNKSSSVNRNPNESASVKSSETVEMNPLKQDDAAKVNPVSFPYTDKENKSSSTTFQQFERKDGNLVSMVATTHFTNKSSPNPSPQTAESHDQSTVDHTQSADSNIDRGCSEKSSLSAISQTDVNSQTPQEKEQPNKRLTQPQPSDTNQPTQSQTSNTFSMIETQSPVVNQSFQIKATSTSQTTPPSSTVTNQALQTMVESTYGSSEENPLVKHTETPKSDKNLSVEHTVATTQLYTKAASETTPQPTKILTDKNPDGVKDDIERNNQIFIKHTPEGIVVPKTCTDTKSISQCIVPSWKSQTQVSLSIEETPTQGILQSEVKPKQTDSGNVHRLGYQSDMNPTTSGFKPENKPFSNLIKSESSYPVAEIQSTGKSSIPVLPEKEKNFPISKPIGFQFEIAGDDKESFQCPLCEAIVRHATELPCCAQLLCKDCSIQYEKEEEERQGRHLDLFTCIACKETYNNKEKTWVKSTDKIIQRLQVKCSQKSCDWIGSIQNYQAHEKICDYLEVNCQHFDLGCSQTMERRHLSKHNIENETNHQNLLLNVVKETNVLVSVLDTKREEAKHLMDTRGREIEALQRESTNSERKFEKIDEVIENLEKGFEAKLKTLERSYEAKFATFQNAFETKFTTLQRGFDLRVENLEKGFEKKLKDQETDYETKLIFEQKVFGTRLENVTKDFEQKFETMKKERDLIAANTKKCHELDNERVKLDKKVGELSDLTKDQSELLRVQSDVIQTQCKKIDSLEVEWKDFKTKPTAEDLYGEIENEKYQGLLAEIKNVDKKNETARRDLAREILNLKIFAERISKLHLTLSEPAVRGYEVGDKFLGQIQYEQKDEVRRWIKFADEIYVSKDEGCGYLKDLKEAITEYRKSIYCGAWNQRLLQMTFYGMECGQVLNRYVKIVSSLIVVKMISVKVYQTIEDYEKVVRKEKWCKHSHHVASYFDRYGSCLFVAIFYPMEYRNVYILHAQDEEKKLSVPGNEHLQLDDLHYSINGYVVLHLKK